MVSFSILNAVREKAKMKSHEASWSLKTETAKRAYEIWEAEGRVHGHDLAHWFQAENELFEK